MWQAMLAVDLQAAYRRVPRDALTEGTTNAEGRTRTCTGVAPQGILSPLRLPISPPRPRPNLSAYTPTRRRLGLDGGLVRYSTRRYIRTRLRRLALNPSTGTPPAPNTIRMPWSKEATNVLPPWYSNRPR